MRQHSCPNAIHCIGSADIMSRGIKSSATDGVGLKDGVLIFGWGPAQTLSRLHESVNTNDLTVPHMRPPVDNQGSPNTPKLWGHLSTEKSPCGNVVRLYNYQNSRIRRMGGPNVPKEFP